MKIYRRLRTWILVGILMAITVAAAILIERNSPRADNADWRAETSRHIEENKRNTAQPGVPDSYKQMLERDTKVMEYRLQNDLPPADKNTLWKGVLDSANLISLVTIFTVIIAADIVAAEFATGTIKMLLIRPASRAKILLSKYAATLAFSILLLVILFATSFVINGILYGFGGADLPYLYASKDGAVHQTGMLVHALQTYGLNCAGLVMIVTLAFMVSTIFRSSSMAIGLSLGVMFLGQLILGFFSKYNWIKYYLFANTDLTVYLTGMPPKEGMSMGFSLTVLAVYFLIFNILSWSIFMKRDVAA
ncbi:ABC transporter permease [Paenibacillus sp. CC-CFT747]|nr:ABC transporter permease [Paenibacillus sp. CC-CFT747]